MFFYLYLESAANKMLLANVVNPSQTSAGLTNEDLIMIENSIKVLVSDAHDNSSDWEDFYEKPNFVAKRKPSSSLVIAKVETLLPFALLDIFKVFVNQKIKLVVNPDRAANELVQVMSDHTWIEYSESKVVSYTLSVMVLL